jgi:hypothetical protein
MAPGWRVLNVRLMSAWQLVVAAVLVAPRAWADDVPAPLALMTMLKVLAYDTGFPALGSGEFVVAVPYAPGQQAAADALVKVASRVEVHTINGRDLKFQAVALGELAGQKRLSAVLLHAGLQAASAKEALQVATRAKLYSLVLDEALVKDGALLGVSDSAGKPQVVVNVSVAKALGVELSASVLRLAKTVQ